MPQQGREIKNRLRSIRNSRKITKAMELVSAAKMRRAITAALATRTYSTTIWNTIERVMSAIELKPNDPLFHFFYTTDESQKNNRITMVIFTSNRGLCGAFNSNILQKAIAFIRTHGRDNVELILFGKKGVTTLNNLGIQAKFAFKKDDSAKNVGSISEMATYVYQQFMNKQTDRVVVAYTDYRSPVVHIPVIRQLFPIIRADTVSRAVDLTPETKKTESPTPTDYLYEPNTRGVLFYLIPRIIEVQLYQALLESNASEHSARMVAMKNATDAAAEMIDELILAFNRARQASITKEIAEISAGSAAII